MKRVKLKISNRVLYSLISFIVLGLFLTSVNAFGSGGPASYFGHSGEEIVGVCKPDGSDCPPFQDSRFSITAGKLCYDGRST